MPAKRNGTATVERDEPSIPREIPTPEPALTWRHHDHDYVPRFPIAEIHPWEKNPRKNFDVAGLEELAESIRRDGMQQPIVVREIAHRTGEYQGVQIVMGERRYRAARLADLTTIPVIVRIRLSDLDALRLAVVENVEREDLNPIEEAQGYEALLSEGESQSALGKAIGKSQSTIANRLRLLNLPDAVQGLVSSGQLDASHARALLRFGDFPAVVEKLAELTVARGASAKELEKGVPFQNELSMSRLIRTFSSYDTQFDMQETCHKCPFTAFRKGAASWNHVCLKPEHWKELNDAAIAAKAVRLKEIEAEVERRKAAAKAGVPASPPAAEAPGTQSPQGAPAAAPSAATLLNKRDLRYDQYADIPSPPPPGCSELCPCRTKVLTYQGREEYICMEPGRMNSLKGAQTRIENKARRERFETLATEVHEAITGPMDERRAALIARTLLYGVPVDLKRKIAARLTDAEAKSVLEGQMFSSYDVRKDWAALSRLDVETLLNLCVEALILREMSEAYDERWDRTPMADWLLGRGAPAGERPATDWESDGEEETSEANGGELCQRCGQAFPIDLVGSPVVERVDYPDDEIERATVRLESGVLLLVRDEDVFYYCPCCASQVAICRGCGCTDEVGCEEGCSWVEDDLCSVCEAKLPVQTAEAKAFDEDPACASCGTLRAENGSKYCRFCDPKSASGGACDVVDAVMSGVAA